MPFFINTTEIDDDAVYAEMQHHPAGSLAEALDEAALALAVRELLVQEARRQGITPPVGDRELAETQDEYLINTLLEREIRIPDPTGPECMQVYRRHIRRFTRADAALVPFEEVQEGISAYLRDCAWHTAARQYVQVLASRAMIAGLTLPDADGPLVQ